VGQGEPGKIEKLSAEEFEGGKKLYLVPLVCRGKELPAEYLEKFDRYSQQVENQLGDLELKLGPINKIMDWNKCLFVGLQKQKVFSRVYESYTEAGKKRNEHIAKHICGGD
jgi:hypothetical protein